MMIMKTMTMISDISLHHLLPRAFEGVDIGHSDVWLTDLTFHRGRSYLISAESGRGKTSLCAYLYGQRTDYSGTLTLHDHAGHPVALGHKSLTRLRQSSLALMPQDLRIFPELTPVENVMLKVQLTRTVSEDRVRQLLCELGLSDRLSQPCARISTGQQQRVAFVRMLCQPADFCLLDEPISHLDEANAQLMSQLLADKQQREGCAVIVTTIGHTLPFAYDSELRL